MESFNQAQITPTKSEPQLISQPQSLDQLQGISQPQPQSLGQLQGISQPQPQSLYQLQGISQPQSQPQSLGQFRNISQPQPQPQSRSKFQPISQSQPQSLSKHQNFYQSQSWAQSPTEFESTRRPITKTISRGQPICQPELQPYSLSKFQATYQPEPQSQPQPQPNSYSDSSSIAMANVRLIDIDGRQIEKEINLNWKFSLWAKALVKEYEADNSNLSIKLSARSITYTNNQNDKLQSLGIEAGSRIDVLHAQKGCPDISICINDQFNPNSNKKSMMVNPLWLCSRLCSELESLLRIRLNENNRNADAIGNSTYLNHQKYSNRTLRDLKIKHNSTISILVHVNGGFCGDKV